MIAMLLAVALLGGAPDRVAQAQDVARPVTRPVAVLRGLDKFSGLAETFEAVVGAPVAYRRLTITVRACRDTGAAAEAWLEITDANAPAAPVFAGWMIAASPALSALDHPRYDVWVLSCKTVSGDAS